LEVYLLSSNKKSFGKLQIKLNFFDFIIARSIAYRIDENDLSIPTYLETNA